MQYRPEDNRDSNVVDDKRCSYGIQNSVLAGSKLCSYEVETMFPIL